MIYFLFVLAISLAAVVGLQFAYLAFLEANNRQLKSRIQEMEQTAGHLRTTLKTALAHKSAPSKPVWANTDETWPEYLETDK